MSAKKPTKRTKIVTVASKAVPGLKVKRVVSTAKSSKPTLKHLKRK